MIDERTALKSDRYDIRACNISLRQRYDEPDETLVAWC
jgi:hypothetical protein